MISNETDEVIKKLFDLLEYKDQNNLESMRGCGFVFDYVSVIKYI